MRITTESGSVYYIDTDAKTMRRLPGENTFTLQGDGEDLPYTTISDIKVGESVSAVWYRTPEADARFPTVRLTTPVVLIEEELI